LWATGRDGLMWKCSDAWQHGACLHARTRYSWQSKQASRQASRQASTHARTQSSEWKLFRSQIPLCLPLLAACCPARPGQQPCSVALLPPRAATLAGSHAARRACLPERARSCILPTVRCRTRSPRSHTSASASRDCQPGLRWSSTNWDRRPAPLGMIAQSISSHAGRAPENTCESPLAHCLLCCFQSLHEQHLINPNLRHICVLDVEPAASPPFPSFSTPPSRASRRPLARPRCRARPPCLCNYSALCDHLPREATSRPHHLGRACSACADSSSEHQLFPPPANSVPCFSRCSTRAGHRIGPSAGDLHLLHMGPKGACFLNTHKVSNSVLGYRSGRIRLPTREPHLLLRMWKIDCSISEI
jgi:hypothetical protein